MSRETDVLHFMMAGSVDDGKSTLIGRLLHDTDAIYQDQLAAIRAASEGRGAGDIDFSLVTDGLRAEREQGITIDVSYRYFSTPRRTFIVADAPGHEQYTRNMATAASSANAAVILMDARKGMLPQTCRHVAIAWLMGIRDFAVAVNKMDLVEFREDIFRDIEVQFREFISRLGELKATFFPCVAIDGDNIVRQTKRMGWYNGRCLLEHLEAIHVEVGGFSDLRFPIQTVIRSGGSRFYGGRVESRELVCGDTVVAVPSGQQARVTQMQLGDRVIHKASPSTSICVKLDRELDLGRGDMLVHATDGLKVSRRWAATLLWMSREPMAVGRPYLMKHTSRSVCGSVTRLLNAIDPVTLERREQPSLSLNEFGDVEIETHHPLYADAYRHNRATGAFIVVEPISNETVAAGMIDHSLEGASALAAGVQQGMAVWFTGLSSAGKSTISKGVYDKLWARGFKVELLDGDVVRRHLSRDLGFSKEDRDENIRRLGFMAELLTRNGVIVLVAAISPYREVRDEIRRRIGAFLEVYVNAPLNVVEERDLKGIYRRCRAGELKGVTGIDDPYEPPITPEVECRTDRETLAQSVEKVILAIDARIG